MSYKQFSLGKRSHRCGDLGGDVVRAAAGPQHQLDLVQQLRGQGLVGAHHRRVEIETQVETGGSADAEAAVQHHTAQLADCWSTNRNINFSIAGTAIYL